MLNLSPLDEGQLRLVVDSIPAMIWIVLPGGKVEFMNRRWLEYSGLSMDDAIADGGAQTIHPEDQPRVMEKWRQALAAGQAYEDEMRLRGGDGQYRWFLVRTVPLRDENGKIVRWYGVSTDIQDRRQVEEALRKSDRVLRAAEELGHTGSWEHDLLTGDIFNTDENRRLFFGDDPTKGARFEDYLDAIHPDDREYVISRHAQLLAGGPGDIEFRVVWPDGSIHVLYGRATVVRDSSGRPVRNHGTNVDITQRKQTEHALRESQQLLQLVLATLPVGVAVTNRAGDIILNNAASSRIWGTDRVIVSGPERWAQSIGFWHDSGKRIGAAEWASVRAISEGQTSLNELIDIEAFDGKKKIMQNSSAPIRDTEERIVGAVIVNEDVTERVHAVEGLRDSAERLQHLSHRLLAVQEEERRNLSRELHDEFGQMLAAVTLHLEAAKAAAGQAAQRNLEECAKLLQRAGAQVRGLALDLRPTMLETVGLDATLRWLAAQHQNRSGIAVQIVGHLGDVAGDLAIACFRVAQEALTNVVRHAGARHVWIELSQDDVNLELVIRDDGVGFDTPNALKEACARGHLGLVGIKERVQILGGSLEIDSKPERGTRIRVSLPLAVSVLEQEPAA